MKTLLIISLIALCSCRGKKETAVEKIKEEIEIQKKLLGKDTALLHNTKGQFFKGSVTFFSDTVHLSDEISHNIKGKLMSFVFNGHTFLYDSVKNVWYDTSMKDTLDKGFIQMGDTAGNKPMQGTIKMKRNGR